MNTPFKLFVVLAVLQFGCGAGAAPAADSFPYDTKSGRETGLLLGAGVFYATGWWLDRHFEPHDLLEASRKDRDHVQFWDRPATRWWSPRANLASDLLVGAQLAAPAGLVAGGGGRDQPDRLALMYAETMALNTGLTWMLKNAFDRTRPLVYNDDPAIPAELKTSATARKSFPSGHTANAFASMVFLARVFERTNPGSEHKDLVWGACLTSAAVTGGLRIAAGRHFPTDVLTGAALGAAIGWLVPELHQVDEAQAGTPTNKASVSFAWRVGF